MFFLTVSAIALIASVQLAFRGRGYLYSPGELRGWWTDESAPAEELLRQEQRDDFALWLRWMHRAATAYNLGIVLLGCGMLGLLAPPESASVQHAWSRWAGVGAATLGTGWEAVALVRAMWKRHRGGS
ncbi:hypothetical protein [Streptomyces sp. 2A115]|uniref:hypothetical protein n=1 Tax=Streptomyces sp. 2A115 TaxID=3457439 RepID=UPI003FD11D9D